MDKNYEIIIAHYNEDIEWLKPYAENVIIYHKGNETVPRFKVKKWIKLENVWREWHTYLYHIINNYSNLEDINIFLQGNISDHSNYLVSYNNPIDYIKETNKHGFSISRLFLMKKKSPQIKWEWKFKDMIKEKSLKWYLLEYDKFYENILWKKQPLIDFVFYCWNFWVSKNNILNNKKEFYEKILSYLEKYSNPIEWHYLERIWFRIFNKNYLAKLYLIKKIKFIDFFKM